MREKIHSRVSRGTVRVNATFLSALSQRLRSKGRGCSAESIPFSRGVGRLISCYTSFAVLPNPPPSGSKCSSWRSCSTTLWRASNRTVGLSGAARFSS